MGAVPGHQNQPDKPYGLQILSKQRIPFLTTSEMKAIMRQSYVHRFNLNDGVGHLHPTTALPCPVCCVEGEWSEEESWSHSTTIVCYNQVFPAEGMCV